MPWDINKSNVCFLCSEESSRCLLLQLMTKNLCCFAPNPVQMGCLSIGLEMLKIVHKVTLHLSFSALFGNQLKENKPRHFFSTTKEMLEELWHLQRCFLFVWSKEDRNLEAFSSSATQWTNSINPTWKKKRFFAVNTNSSKGMPSWFHLSNC